MAKQAIESDEEIEKRIIQDELFVEGEDPNDEFPKCTNISAGMLFYNFIPRPSKLSPPEFVHIPFKSNSSFSRKGDLRVHNTIAQWNLCWEAAQERPEFFFQLGELPSRLQWLRKHSNRNIYLLPGKPYPRYYSYVLLYHLLGPKTLAIVYLTHVRVFATMTP